MKFACISVGDTVRTERSRYEVIEVTAKRFRCRETSNGYLATFRKKDGRVVGSPHHIFFVEPVK